jgi:hypothetical protein
LRASAKLTPCVCLHWRDSNADSTAGKSNSLISESPVVNRLGRDFPIGKGFDSDVS